MINDFGLDSYDYGARYYGVTTGRWGQVDPTASTYTSWSPFNYVRANPIIRIDPTGRWDVIVHLFNDRAKFGYGIAVVYDRLGNEVYRFNVRAEGIKGRNRTITDADTPLGVYDIPDESNVAWKTGGSRRSYGPHPRLVLNEESGEIIETGRNEIRIHGGGQEYYDDVTKTWQPFKNPILNKTNGCLRAFDCDMMAFKSITDNLESSDPLEYPGKVKIYDNLEENKTPSNYVEKRSSIQISYDVPKEEKKFWKNYIRNMLNYLGK